MTGCDQMGIQLERMVRRKVSASKSLVATNSPRRPEDASKEEFCLEKMAERVGFEPTVEFPPRSLSRRVLSTAQSPLRGQ